MAKPDGGRYMVEDFAQVGLDDIRCAVGSRRKLRSLENFKITLPNGDDLAINLLRRPGRFGGDLIYIACPSCQHATRSLRITPQGPLCLHCLRRVYAAKYRSQVQQKT